MSKLSKIVSVILLMCCPGLCNQIDISQRMKRVNVHTSQYHVIDVSSFCDIICINTRS